MKKFCKILPIIAIVAFGILMLCACQPGTVADVEGTYELTTFNRKYPVQTTEVAEGEQAPEQEYTTRDFIEEAGIKAYLVIKKDGTGYMAYSDNSTALVVRAITINFTKDSKDENKISMIGYNDGNGSNYRQTAVARGSGLYHPGIGQESLYVNATHSGVTLVRNNLSSALYNRNYSQNVTYTKISGKVDLTTVGEKLKKTLPTPIFELQGLDGVLVSYGLYSNAQSEYIYYVVDFNAATKKATVYYRLKGSEEGATKENLDVTYRVEELENSKKLYVTIDGTTYYDWCYGISPTSLTYEGQVENGETYYRYLNHTYQTVEEFIESEESAYESTLEQQSQQE